MMIDKLNVFVWGVGGNVSQGILKALANQPPQTKSDRHLYLSACDGFGCRQSSIPFSPRRRPRFSGMASRSMPEGILSRDPIRGGSRIDPNRSLLSGSIRTDTGRMCGERREVSEHRKQ